MHKYICLFSDSMPESIPNPKLGLPKINSVKKINYSCKWANENRWVFIQKQMAGRNVVQKVHLFSCSIPLYFILNGPTNSQFVGFNFFYINFPVTFYVENKHLFTIFPLKKSSQCMIWIMDAIAKRKKAGDSDVCAQEQYFSYLYRNRNIPTTRYGSIQVTLTIH